MIMSLSKQIENIRSLIPLTMLQDRPILTGRLEEITNSRRTNRDSKRLAARLSSLEKRIKASMREREGRLSRRPEIGYPKDLPITARRDEIVRAIQENRVVII